MKASDHVAGIVKSIDRERVFADGAELCAMLTLIVDHLVERTRMVERYPFRGDRIASVDTVFDTGPLVRQSRHAMTTAIDQLCGMAVAPGVAAATGEHAGGTFYFCGEGRAIAFAESPAR